jgi:predicted metal-binding membrane protein
MTSPDRLDPDCGVGGLQGPLHNAQPVHAGRVWSTASLSRAAEASAVWSASYLVRIDASVGVYQLGRLKDRCLEHCHARSGCSCTTARTAAGPATCGQEPSTGAYCLGCCWGTDGDPGRWVRNMAATVGLAAVVLIEKT